MLNCLLPFLCLAAHARAGVITLDADARQIGRNILHCHESIPVHGGEVDLVYPKWIPGEHGPYGPLNEIVNLHFSANGQNLSWRRDDVEMFDFHLTTPAGTAQVDVDFDEVWQPGNYSTAHLARVSWHNFVLYPSNTKSDDVMVAAKLRMPDGWKCACALPISGSGSGEVEFPPVSLTMLVDSPALIGEHYHQYPISDSAPMHYLEVFADTEQATQVPPDFLKNCRQMVAETGALYGARHYRSYHFLLTFSDNGAFDGLEHHESSEDGMDLNAIAQNPQRLSYLLCHEYTHSWNGKYRRPAGMSTPNYQEPMKDDLLWIYEGLTEYLGTVLIPRSGFWSDERFREALASICAVLDHRTGRNWRTVDDVARSLPGLDSPNQWQNARRQRGDFYYEGVLIWLDADVTIRNLTKGQKSLNDFCRIFHGGPNGDPFVHPYTLAEVIHDLNQVAPYDWAQFFRDRVFTITSESPKGGINNAGWTLVYNDSPNQALAGYERASVNGLTYSLGLRMADDGVIDDVVMGMPGDKAGLSPGMKITSVNGEKYTGKGLAAAVHASKASSAAIKLGISYNGEDRSVAIDYHGGEVIPHLVRDASRPDMLSQVSRPLAVAGG